MADPEAILRQADRELADALLTVRQAALYLNVEAKAIRKWVHAGVIVGAVRLPNGHLRIPKPSLQNILRVA